MTHKIVTGGRGQGKTLRLRLGSNDQLIVDFLDALPEGTRSQWIREAIQEKIRGGSNLENALEEIRKSILEIMERQKGKT